MSDDRYDLDESLWKRCAELSAIHHGDQFTADYLERYKAGGEFEGWEWGHWRWVIRGFLTVPQAAFYWPDGVENVRYIELFVECPHHPTGDFARFGLDRDMLESPDRQRYDSAWMRAGRRVEVSTKVRGDSEFTQFGDHRVDIPCPVPRCRYNFSRTVPEIIVKLHRFRHAVRDDERPVIELPFPQ